MSFRTTIQLIKLNAKLPKNESNIRYHYRLIKSAFNLFIDLLIEPKKKRTLYMRLFDTYDPLTQIDILTKSVQFAKREIADFGNPTNRTIEDIATDYTHQEGVIVADYTRVNILIITAWTGPLPTKFPRP